MKRVVLYIIVLLLAVQCFAQNSPQQKNLIIADTVVNNAKFRIYSFEFESAEFSKKIYFLLPLIEDVAVRQMIWDSIIGWQYSSEMLELELQEEVSMYMDRVADNPELVNAEKMEERYSDIEYYESSWYVTPTFVSDEYIALTNYFSEFNGGAIHHQWGEVAYVFSLSTGKQIFQDDILDDTGSHRYLVAYKLYELLQKNLGYDPDELFVDNVMQMLNGNFYFTEDELIYMYVPYEVACYAAGEPLLSLPKKWLKNYLNVDGPLYKYWFGKKKK
ncbi:MAG: DUF3298 domain-containing protein [Bacteroidales bacterium]|nr:DUF3298 domain-containing protein [Bacteroidales bacterium]